MSDTRPSPPSGPGRPPPIAASTSPPSPPASPNRPPPPTPEQIAAAARARETKPAEPPLATAEPEPEISAPVEPELVPLALPAAPRDTGIPPARIALEAGDHSVRPEYDPGRRTVDDTRLTTVPIMARPADSAAPAMADGVMLRPARDMTPAEADAALNGCVVRCKIWMADYPHEARGEAAAFLEFVRALIGRDRHIADALAYGQTREPDDIETRLFLPSPESQALALARTEATTVIRIYERALAAANLRLTGTDQNAVDGLRRTLSLA